MADIGTAKGTNAWPDSQSDTRWLSYDDLVEITGIKRDSVARMVRRKKWPRRTGNERGSIRIAVPVDIIDDLQARRIVRPAVAEAPAPATKPDLAAIARVIAALEAALAQISELEAALAAMQVERDQLQAELSQSHDATNYFRDVAERNRAAAVEERMNAAEARARTADQRARLTVQVNALADELARLHVAPRAPIVEPPVTPPPLLSRFVSLARRLRGVGG